MILSNISPLPHLCILKFCFKWACPKLTSKAKAQESFTFVNAVALLSLSQLLQNAHKTDR